MNILIEVFLYFLFVAVFSAVSFGIGCFFCGLHLGLVVAAISTGVLFITCAIIAVKTYFDLN